MQLVSTYNCTLFDICRTLFLRSLKSDCSRDFLLFLLLETNLKKGQSFYDKRRKSVAKNEHWKNCGFLCSFHSLNMWRILTA